MVRAGRAQTRPPARRHWSALPLALSIGALIAPALQVADPGTLLAQPRPAGRPGAIRGRVELRRVAPATERRPTVSDLGAPRQRDVSDRRRSVVYLESAPRRAFEQTEPSRVMMDQRKENFIPHLLAVTTGTVVDFPNGDPFYHNVFSLSKAGSFDLGRYAQGKSRSVQFNKAGIIRVFCEIHSHMNAYILVFSHPYFGVTDEAGRYRIDNVPPGTYSVVAWNEGVSSEPRPVTLPDGGITELDFALR
jgi:plastocyanin